MSETSDRNAAQNRETTIRLGAMVADTFTAIALEAHRSIQSGSELTGAPGQPVDTGNLRRSWQIELAPNHAVIGTNVEYAESIEDGLSYAHGGTPMTLRSAVGGFHSVALTVAGFDRIVDAVTRRMQAGQVGGAL